MFEIIADILYYFLLCCSCKTRVGADMSRRQDLAGRTAISNGYTVFYNDDGYAYKAIKGVADYTPHQDINAGNGSYGKSGAWTDNEMLSALDRSKIQDIRNRLQRGEITGDQAFQSTRPVRGATASVEVMATKQEEMGTKVSRIDEKMTELEGKSAKRWDSLVDKVIWLIRSPPGSRRSVPR